MSRKAANDSGEGFPAIIPGVSQSFTFDGTSGQGDAIDATIVRIVATENCWVKFGENPTAAVGDLYIVANVPEYFGINRGDVIAVVQDSAGGWIYITAGE
jgi:hypothetical protein